MRHIVISIISALYISDSLAHMSKYKSDYKPSLLSHALRIGTDGHGTILYLCRAKLFNSKQPGKTWAGYNRCNVPYDGKEYIVNEFTIPDQREFEHFRWAQMLQNAIVIGNDTNGRPLFLCQSNFHGTIQPGKTWAGYNHCNITFAGKEIITDSYRVLVSGDRNRI